MVPTTLSGDILIEPWDSFVDKMPTQAKELGRACKNYMRQFDMMNKEYMALQREYKAVYRATRRALHEFDVSAIDLRAAEARRKYTSQQHDLAKLGRLGIDAGKNGDLDVMAYVGY